MTVVLVCILNGESYEKLGEKCKIEREQLPQNQVNSRLDENTSSFSQPLPQNRVNSRLDESESEISESEISESESVPN